MVNEHASDKGKDKAAQPKGNAAASAQQDSTLGSGSFATGLTYDLNGVTLTVANQPQTYPAQGDENHPEWLWPTSALEYRGEVQMTSGETWFLNRPPSGLYGGGTQVSLKPRTGSRIAVFNVPEADLDTPIWSVGRPLPTPEPEEPPTPVDPGDVPGDNEGPSTPGEPAEPPAGG